MNKAILVLSLLCSCGYGLFSVNLEVHPLFSYGETPQEGCYFLEQLYPPAINISQGDGVNLTARFHCSSKFLHVSAFAIFPNGSSSEILSQAHPSNTSTLIVVKLKGITSDINVRVDVRYRNSSGGYEIVQSNLTTIEVQGVLDCVTDIHHQFVAPNSCLVCYKQPVSLDNVPYYFNLSVYGSNYSVVYNTTTNYTCVNITFTSPDLTIEYLINVTSINKAGIGQSANHTITYPGKPSYISIIAVDTRECDNDFICLHISAEISSANCLNCTPTEITIIENCGNEVVSSSFQLDQFTNGHCEFGRADQNTQYKIKRHQFCRIDFTFSNIAGIGYNTNYNISSHNTQDVVIWSSNTTVGNVCFRCTAIQNNTASGCQFNFQHPINDMFNFTVYYNGSTATKCIYIPDGINHVLTKVYDVDRNNYTASNPAWTDVVFIKAKSNEAPSHPTNGGDVNLGIGGIIGIVIAVVVVPLVACTVTCIIVIVFIIRAVNQRPRNNDVEEVDQACYQIYESPQANRKDSPPAPTNELSSRERRPTASTSENTHLFASSTATDPSNQNEGPPIDSYLAEPHKEESKRHTDEMVPTKELKSMVADSEAT